MEGGRNGVAYMGKRQAISLSNSPDYLKLTHMGYHNKWLLICQEYSKYREMNSIQTTRPTSLDLNIVDIRFFIRGVIRTMITLTLVIML